MTKLEKALELMLDEEREETIKRFLARKQRPLCPEDFGMENCRFYQGCTLTCEDCWNEEVEE